MDYSWTKRSDTECILVCAIPQEEFAPFMSRARREFSNELRISGFRPGKIPPEIVERKVGRDRIVERAVRLAVVETYTEAIRGKSFEIIDTPRVELTQSDSNNGISYRASVQVLPSIMLPDYRSIVQRTKRRPVRVTEEELEGVLHYLRASRAQTQIVDRPAARGDLVEIDFRGSMNGHPVAELTSMHHPLIIGEGKLLPDFESALVGMRRGESKSVAIRIPDSHRSETLRGKDADFTITMRLIQLRVLPDPDDAFAQKLGAFSTYTELRQSVHDGLVREKEEKERERFRIAMLEDITREMPLSIPNPLIRRETEKMFHELMQNIEEMGLDRDAYFRHIGKTADEIKKGWGHDAERRVRFALALREIARREGITVSDDEIQKRMDELLKRYPNASIAKKRLASDDLREYTRGIVRNEKVLVCLERCNNGSSGR